MKKKLVSLLLALALVVTLVTLGSMALAAEEESTVTFAPYTDEANGSIRKYCACGNKFVADANGTIAYVNGEDGCLNRKDEDGNVVDGCDGTIIVWSPRSTNLSSTYEHAYVNDNGTVSGMAFYLTKDIKSGSQQFGNEAGDYYLDLNGYSFTRNDARVITPQTGINLYITDTSKEKNGYIASVDTDGSVYGSQGATIWFRYNNCSLTLFAGTIDGTQESSGHATIGGNAISNNKLTVVSQFGGTIKSGNSAAQSGFTMANGTYNMYGGQIIGGEGEEGGALYIGQTATANLYNGTISGGTATNGGAVYSLGTLNMEGGRIENGTATTAGGNLYVNGKTTISGGTLYNGCVSAGGGGNILIGETGDVDISGGTFSYGHTSAQGGNLRTTAGCTLDITGGRFEYGGINPTTKEVTTTQGGNVLILGGTVTMTGCELYGGQTTQYGGNLRSSVALTLGKGVVISDGQSNYGGNITNNSGGHITIDGATINGGTATTDGGSIYSVKGMTIVSGTVSGGTAGGNGGNLYAESKLDIQGGTISGGHANNGGNLYSKGVVTISGGTISGGVASNEGGNIVQYSGVSYSLTMTGGLVENGQAKNGGNVLNGGNFTMSGGTITGGVASGRGGNVQSFRGNSGTFTMSGDALISNGTADYGGNLFLGGVLKKSDGTYDLRWGTLIMNGGRIVGGSATDTATETEPYRGCGGNIHIGEKGKLVLNDGSVENGSANVNGGNIYAGSYATVQMEINGGNVFGGTANDLGNDIYVGALVGSAPDDANEGAGYASISAGTISGDVYTAGKLDLSGTTVIGKLQQAAVMCVSFGDLTEGADVMIESQAVDTILATMADGTDLAYLSDNDPVRQLYYLEGEGLYLGKYGCKVCGGVYDGCDHAENVKYTPWTEEASLPKTSGWYYLTGTVNPSGQQNIAADAQVVLDLNGQQVIGAESKRIYALFNTGCGLTITDTLGGGILKASGTARDRGRAIWLRLGDFHMYAGTVDASGVSNATVGAAVHVPAQMTFYLYGGNIIGGEADSGGAIYAEGNVNLLGGTVSGGNAGNGGNIYIAGTGTLTIDGCCVSDGTATTSGGNVYSIGSVYLNSGSVLGGTAGSGGNMYLAGTVSKLTNAPVTGEDGSVTETEYVSEHVGGKLYMTGGLIDGGTATTGNGGNLYANLPNTKLETKVDGTVTASETVYFYEDSIVEITGGVISNGKTLNEETNGLGGNLFVRSYLTVDNAQILGGESKIRGGSVYCGYDAIFTNATITGATAPAAPGVYLGNDTTVSGGELSHIYQNNGALTLKGALQLGELCVNQDGSSFALDVSELNNPTPIRLSVEADGVLATATTDKTGCFVMAQPIYQLSYASEKLIVSYVQMKDVYVSNGGNDANDGTQANPVKTMGRALKTVENGGTVHIVDVVNVGGWGDHDKTATITGGELNVTKASPLYIKDSIHFKNMTLRLPVNVVEGETEAVARESAYRVYCCGNKTVIDSDVTVLYGAESDNLVGYKVHLYGGIDNTGTVESTDLTVLAGTWGKISGGSNGSDISGDVHLTVGGKVNNGADYQSHDYSSYFLIVGGSNQGDIAGTVYMNVLDGTTGSSIHGGSVASSSVDCTIGNIEMYVTGGEGMGVSCGGRGGRNIVTGVANLYYQGGHYEQIFGGGLNSLTGEVNTYLTGGTVTRRVYGGCYNDTSGLSLTSDHRVVGNINLYIGSGVNITLDYNDGDLSIYGHSRCKATGSDTELSRIIFMDYAAYQKYASKLKAQDYAQSFLMGSTKAADYVCYMGANADDTTDVITFGANEVEDNAGNALDLPSSYVMLSLDSDAYGFDGVAVTPAEVTYSDDWSMGQAQITYANNDAIGTATVTMTVGDYSVSREFAIMAYKYQVIVEGNVAQFIDLQSAFDNANGGYVKLLQSSDENASVDGDLYLDLNGQSLTGTITVTGTLYGMDSTTNDYDCTDGYGTITHLVGNYARHHKTNVTGKVLRYLAVNEDGAISFHRIYLGITKMSLRPGATGVGYTAVFGGDHRVLEALNDGAAYGYGLWLGDNSGNKVSAMMDAQSFTSGKTVSLLLRNYDVENFGTTPVHAQVYLQLDDGTVITSATYSYTMKDMVEAVNRDLASYQQPQILGVQTMCRQFAQAMANWDIKNILDYIPQEA